jgi:glycerol dehydrogenase
MVAMGTLTQLVLETRLDEANRVARFFTAVGLPIHLAQMSLERTDRASIDTLVDGTLAFPYTANMPLPVTAERLRVAVLEADALGRNVARSDGDAAYRRLHAA